MSVRTISLNEVACDKEMHIVIYQGSAPSASAASAACACECSEKLLRVQRDLRDMQRDFQEMSKRLLQIELKEEPPRSSPFFGASVAPEPAGIVVRRLSEVASIRPSAVESDRKTTFQEIIDALPIPSRVVVASEYTEVHDNQDNQDNQYDSQDEDQGDSEDEEVALELEEFEYKGVTYFRDTENLVYQKDAEDDLDDTPIGVWNETKQKVIKYAKA